MERFFPQTPDRMIMYNMSSYVVTYIHTYMPNKHGEEPYLLNDFVSVSEAVSWVSISYSRRMARRNLELDVATSEF